MEKKLLEYIEKFGEGFPMIPLAWGRTEEETIELIDQCIKAGKNAYDLGLIEISSDIDY